VDIALLEHCLREDLNRHTPRAMAVLRPLRLVIENYPPGRIEMLEAVNNPEDAAMGVRAVPFSGVLYVERDDFREDPPKQWFRLAPGAEVRLKHAYFVRCHQVIKDPATGEIRELRCTYDPASRGGASPDGRKVKGTLHWVSAEHAIESEVRLYDHLFSKANPLADKDEADFRDSLNPDSLVILRGCQLEPDLATAVPGQSFQFLRHGYFCVDSADSRPGSPVFNRTVTLRDTWAKIERAQSQS
jgi:glutaminyl-tRNA synthetase